MTCESLFCLSGTLSKKARDDFRCTYINTCKKKKDVIRATLGSVRVLTSLVKIRKLFSFQIMYHYKLAKTTENCSVRMHVKYFFNLKINTKHLVWIAVCDEKVWT